jgi:hypothetical protein
MSAPEVDMAELGLAVRTNARFDNRIEKALRLLSPRQREILRLRFGIGHTPQELHEVARRFELPYGRVLQIERRALGLLRSYAIIQRADAGLVGRRRPRRQHFTQRQASTTHATAVRRPWLSNPGAS